MLNPLISAFIAAALSVGALAGGRWRQASEAELKAVIPARATVEKERIETEFRTASGVTDGSGKFIAGAVLITAGYAAEGKYSHWLITHAPIRCGQVELRPGEYVFGFKRMDSGTLEVKFYEAATGKFLGEVEAHIDPKRGAVRSLLIAPPDSSSSVIKIGRFFFEYTLSQ